MSSNYSINISGAVAGVLTIANTGTGVTVSGTTNAPNGARVSLRIGARVVNSTVNNGNFQLNYDKRLNSVDYRGIILISNPLNNKDISRREFTLRLFYTDFTINVDGADQDSILTVMNKSTDFDVSGTTNAPNGARVLFKLGIHTVSSLVSGGKFKITFDRSIQKREYEFSITVISPSDKKHITKKEFILFPVDTQPPVRISSPLQFSSSRPVNNTISVSWEKPFDQFAIKEYKVFKNGILVSVVTTNKYITDAMQPNQIDAYRIVAMDDSDNPSSYSVGYAVSRILPSARRNSPPVLTVIDLLQRTYSTTNNSGNVVVNPVTVSFNSIFDNSDICHLTNTVKSNNMLKFIVASITPGIGSVETMKTSQPSTKKALQVGDIIASNDNILWTPSEKFSTNKDVVTLKAIYNDSIQSSVNVPLRIKLL